MIYFAYSRTHQATFALHDEVLIRIRDREGSEAIQVLDRATEGATLVTHLDIRSSRQLLWSTKASYTAQKWVDLLSVGDIVAHLED